MLRTNKAATLITVCSFSWRVGGVVYRKSTDPLSHHSLQLTIGLSEVTQLYLQKPVRWIVFLSDNCDIPGSIIGRGLMCVWQEMLDPSLLLQLPQNPPDNNQWSQTSHGLWLPDLSNLYSSQDKFNLMSLKRVSNVSPLKEGFSEAKYTDIIWNDLSKHLARLDSFKAAKHV